MDFPSGLKKTRQRLSIWQALTAGETPLSAADLAERLQLSGENMALSTVYRVLEAFIQTGAIARRSSGEGPALYEPVTGEHNHYALCMTCRRKFPVEGCPVGLEAARDGDFEIVSHRLEVYGYCGSCRRAES